MLRSTRPWLLAFLPVIAGSIVYPIAGNIAANRLDEALRLWVATPAAISAFIAFTAVAVWLERRARLDDRRREFDLFVPTELLAPEHFGFQVVAARVEPSDLTRRPFVEGTYIAREAVPYRERHSQAPSKTFHERDLRSLLEEGRSFLLIGQPTEGKSRTIFEVVSKLKGFVAVRPKDPAPSDAAIELLRGLNVICIFDDINKAVESRLDLFDFYSCVSKVANLRPMATACRDGRDLEALEAKLATSSMERLFQSFEHSLILRRATEEQFAELKTTLGERAVRPYFSLGSVAMRRAFDEMERRFDAFDQGTKDCLWSLQLLTAAHIGVLTRRRLEIVLEGIFGHRSTGLQVRGYLRHLAKGAFIISSSEADPVVPEAAHVSGPHVARSYRNGQALSDDLGRLEALLFERGDWQAMNSFAASVWSATEPARAMSMWARVWN